MGVWSILDVAEAILLDLAAHNDELDRIHASEEAAKEASRHDDLKKALEVPEAVPDTAPVAQDWMALMSFTDNVNRKMGAHRG